MFEQFFDCTIVCCQRRVRLGVVNCRMTRTADVGTRVEQLFGVVRAFFLYQFAVQLTRNQMMFGQRSRLSTQLALPDKSIFPPSSLIRSFQFGIIVIVTIIIVVIIVIIHYSHIVD
jgi:hypothetical protein